MAASTEWGAEVVPLNMLATGCAARVVEIRAVGTLRRRLFDLGLIPGTRVEAVRRNPFGDPIAYRVRGVTVALRRDDAAQILIRPPGDPDGPRQIDRDDTAPGGMR